MYFALAAQKRHNAIYFMNLNADDAIHARLEQRFRDAGKCCVRFKTLDDLDLETVAEVVRATPMKKFIEHYQISRATTK